MHDPPDSGGSSAEKRNQNFGPLLLYTSRPPGRAIPRPGMSHSSRSSSHRASSVIQNAGMVAAPPGDSSTFPWPSRRREAERSLGLTKGMAAAIPSRPSPARSDAVESTLPIALGTPGSKSRAYEIPTSLAAPSRLNRPRPQYYVIRVRVMSGDSG